MPVGRSATAQRLAAARAQHRPLHPIPDARGIDRAARRRRRGGEFRQALSRPQTRRDRHHEGARRTGTRVAAIYFTQVMLLALIGATIGSPAARRSRTSSPPRSVRSFRCLRAGAVSGRARAGAHLRLLTAAAFAIWPLGARTTCRSRRCFATRWRRTGLPAQALHSGRDRWPPSRSPRSRSPPPMTARSPPSSSARRSPCS